MNVALCSAADADVGDAVEVDKTMQRLLLAPFKLRIKLSQKFLKHNGNAYFFIKRLVISRRSFESLMFGRLSSKPGVSTMTTSWSS